VEALLLRERVRVELLLQPLVGEVDAELLERVGLEDLEAEDVEDADRHAAVAAHRAVDPLHQVVEHVRVRRLGLSSRHEARATRVSSGSRQQMRWV